MPNHSVFQKIMDAIPLVMASVLIVVVAACGGAAGPAASSGPVTLTFWTWVPTFKMKSTSSKQALPISRSSL